ncbi:MAG: 4-hydroxy-tetrahydrodipicolinate synthase [Dokdonella sp.]|uniref:4-hydroxy-tetrahydrodipicolinate synthase n=1 Tax=Dokdonella sp. TaxID=2291710 RepID=UPI0025BAE66D|nr:4-hydroxy-tetrahydrodipicolinate synthase [Dokdonella sp.]MBZ0224010.1 4-hydroxy-tetrahydrodipicolinate synthase [Dokdonella sp.]MCC7255865.1 4-hydroxy-tetrahydrodipicolinate synthase [Dokdonella sp.]
MSLSGSICALATPFRSRDDAIDVAAFERLIDLQITHGTNALVVAGSTGEAAALEESEFSQLLDVAVRHIGQRVPSIAGTGQSGTRRTIAQTRRARDAGIEFALVVAPAYVRPTQEGMYRHFCEVADHGGLPVMLYNVPSRTACDLLPETVARLTAHGNIIGIKEAVADPARMQALLPLRSERFAVFSGDDGSAAQAIRAGADGVISVAANVDPARMARLAASCAGHADTAAALERELQPLFALLGCEPNPIPLKWCLSRLGIGESYLRLPLLALSPQHHAHAQSVLAGLGLVESAAAVG